MFFEGEGTVLWEEVGMLLLDVIKLYTSLVEQDLPKMTKQLAPYAVYCLQLHLHQGRRVPQ